MIPLRRLALALLLCLALVAGASALPGYPYSQTVEYAACDQAIYQQDVVIHRSAGSAYEETVGGLNVWHLYVGTNCQADYDDLRFTDATGTELFYYLWPDFDAASARFAVRLEGATTAGTLTAHYGNAAATTTSDGDAPYLFFDHFKGTSLDTTKWYQVGSPTVSDSNVTVNSKNEEIKSKQSFGAGTILEGRGSLWNANYHIFGLGVHPNSPFIIYQYGHPASGNYNARSSSSTALGSGWTGVHTWAIHRVASGSAKYYIDGNLVATVTTLTGDMPILLQQHDTYTGSSVFDYILVRAYSAAPPTATAFLSGPAPETPPVAGFSASPTSGMAPLAVQFTDASTGTPTSWSWAFGDDETSTAQSPAHTYAAAGTYTVALTATNAEGSDEETKAGYITVYEPGPYYVRTYADLCKVGTGTDGWFLNATYTQTADIQCPAGANFTPIGDGYDFTGSYDGQGYVIRNLTISRPDRSNNALFEFADKGAVFTNIHLEDISITGTDYSGGLISAEWGDEPGDILIENCTVTGVIETRDTYGYNIGGLAGYLEGATIVGCHTDVLMYNGLGADGEVTTVGGLIGYAAVCNISDSSANGNISNCGNKGGGLIGHGDTITLTNCHATGDVRADPTNIDSAYYNGGLVGYIDDSYLSECYATGTVVGGDSGVGGLLGECYRTSAIRCYATGDVEGIESVGGLIGYYDSREMATTEDCYATGAVTYSGSGSEWYSSAGGLIGLWYQYGLTEDGYVKNAYSTGSVSAPNLPAEKVGGLIGKIDSAAGVVALNAFWDTETSGQTTSAGGAVGKTTAEMKTLTTFADWNIATPIDYTDEVWYLVPGEDYPRLAWEGVPATPPTAAFSAAPTSGTAPLTVQFTDTTENTPTAWAWTFGDGGTSAQQHPSHTYDEPGTYTVSLTATNAGGSDAETKAGYITVTAPVLPPVAAFSAAPTSGTAPLTVRFTDTSTGDPTSWTWTFGDGATSTARSPAHTYAAAGTYPVTLTVTSPGGSDVETKAGYITVQAPPTPVPVQHAPAFPYSQQRKETLSFLLMCWGGLAFVGVFCVVIFLLMNGAQRGSGGI